MNLARRLLPLAILIQPVFSIASSVHPMGMLIVRDLGTRGALGKETLQLECRRESKDFCDIKKTTRTLVSIGKIPYGEATQILQEFIRVEEKRTDIRKNEKPSSKATLFWTAVLNKREIYGDIIIPRDIFDRAVIETEAKILKGLYR